jgi:hypothetical protein
MNAKGQPHSNAAKAVQGINSAHDAPQMREARASLGFNPPLLITGYPISI